MRNDIRVVTAYSVRNVIFPDINSARMCNRIFYKNTEQIESVVAVEFRGKLFPTNPLIILTEKPNGNA
jgi:hypothetical protein